MHDIYEALEILNKEKNEIKESKKYKIGNAIVTYGKDIINFDFKAIWRNLQEKKASKIIRKKYYHPLQMKVMRDAKIEYDKCKIAIYTCILGNYDNIQKHLLKFDNVDYYILTDDGKKYEDYKDFYKILELPEEIINKGNIIANRYAKLHPQKFFKEYDYSIYIDGNVRIVSDVRTFVQSISKTTGIAMHSHRERKCIYEEAEVCKLLRRGNMKKIDEQMKKYKQEKFPVDFRNE